jgi:hypothetical protein
MRSPYGFLYLKTTVDKVGIMKSGSYVSSELRGLSIQNIEMMLNVSNDVTDHSLYFLLSPNDHHSTSTSSHICFAGTAVVVT